MYTGNIYQAIWLIDWLVSDRMMQSLQPITDEPRGIELGKKTLGSWPNLSNWLK